MLDAATPFFAHVFQHAKPGSLFLFIDNNDERFYQPFHSLAEQNGLQAIAGEVERFQIDYREEKTALEPLRNPVVTIATHATPTGETEVTFSIRYDVKYGPIGWLLSSLVMKGMFRKVFGKALAGLAYHLKTGKLVTDAVPSAAA